MNNLMELARKIDAINKAEQRGEKIDKKQLVALCVEGKNRMEKGGEND